MLFGTANVHWNEQPAPFMTLLPLSPWSFPALLAALLGLCLRPELVGQGMASLPAGGGVAQVQYSETTYQVHGTVVDGVTGKPIARALVASSDRRLATMTNGEGAFTLQVTPSLAFSQDPRLYLNAQKPGYLAIEAPPVGVALSASADAAPLRLTLMPAGSVAGHVSAADGRPAHHVAVLLMQHTTSNGRRLWTQAGMHRTAADGGFRFSDLRSGEYTVLTMEWSGEQPFAEGRNEVTEQYPPDFLGDVPSLTSATKLRVPFGETAQAELHLHLATYYSVSIPVSGPSEGFVDVAVRGSGSSTLFALSYNRNQHAIEGSLPNGDYDLLLRSFGQQQAYGLASLHVAGAPVRRAPVVLTVPPPITVRLHREFTGTQPPRERSFTRVSLEPADQNAQPVNNGSTQGGQDDELTVTGAQPGRYTVQIVPSFGYVAAVRSGGVDLLSEPLTVDAGGAQPIDVTLRDDGGSVSGTVKAEAGTKPNGPWFVVLLPVDSGGQFAVSGTGEDGSFTLGSAVPGSYRIFALRRSPWELPYRDPDFMRALDNKGVSVTVAPKGVLQVDVPVLDENALEAP